MRGTGLLQLHATPGITGVVISTGVRDHATPIIAARQCGQLAFYVKSLCSTTAEEKAKTCARVAIPQSA